MYRKLKGTVYTSPVQKTNECTVDTYTYVSGRKCLR